MRELHCLETVFGSAKELTSVVIKGFFYLDIVLSVILYSGAASFSRFDAILYVPIDLGVIRGDQGSHEGS